MTSIKKLDVALGLSTAILGLLAIAAWHLDNPLLLRVHPSFAPMQYNTGLGFLISGLAMLALLYGKSGLARVLAGGVLLIGCLTLWQYISGYNLNIDQALMSSALDDDSSNPGRMSPISAFCFVLSGLCLLGFGNSIRNTVVQNLMVLLPPVIIVLASLVLTGYLSGIHSDVGTGNAYRMPVLTALGFIILGCALYRHNPFEKPSLTHHIFGIALLLMVSMLWYFLLVSDLAAKEGLAQNYAKQFRNAFVNGVEVESNAIGRISTRWTRHSGMSQDEWENEATSVLEDTQDIAIVRLDKNHKPIWVMSKSEFGVQQASKLLAGTMCNPLSPQTLQLVTDRDLGPVMLNSRQLNIGRLADGCMVAITGLEQEVARIRKIVGAQTYPLTIVTSDEQILLNEASDGLWSAEADFKKSDLNLSFRVTPKKHQLSAGALPGVVLVFCLLMVMALQFSLHFLKVAKKLAVEAKEAEAFAREAAKFRHEVIEMAPNALVMINQNGLIELVNHQAETIFGYARSDLLGKPIDMLLPLRHQGAHQHHRSSFFKNPGTRAMGGGRDLFARHHDGSEFPVEIGLNPISTSEGLKVLSSIVDISERKKNQKQLEDMMTVRQAILDSTGYAIVLTDVSGVIQIFNHSAERMLGYLADDVIGKHTHTLFHDEAEVMAYAAELSQEFEKVIAPGYAIVAKARYQRIAVEREWTYIAQSGKRIPVLLSLTAIRDHQDRVTGYLGVSIDISERKLFEKKQLEMSAELARINEELKNFAYVASHDLKAPLRGISQIASWISEDMGDSLSSETQEHLRLMRSRINRMDTLLTDLLAYSRAGRSDELATEVDTHEMVKDIFDLAAPGKSIKLILADSLPTLFTPKAPLELVLRNLIGNAIKHHDNKSGFIAVSAHAISSDMTQGFEFEVKDDGPGIPPEHQERVFAMFQTLKPRDEVEGSGMGLALVKKSVESMGGKITLESDGRQGCAFRFTWPSPEALPVVA